jgi:hypothetical protein
VSAGQHLFAKTLEDLFEAGKRRLEKRRIAKMTPKEFAVWREEELTRIHDRAVRLSRAMSDKHLQRQGRSREDLVRAYEVEMRQRRGSELSQPLLDGTDIRHLDLSRFRKGVLKQADLDRCIGDGETILPPGLTRPSSWV